MVAQGGFSGVTPGFNRPVVRALTAFGAAQNALGTATERLSTGLRINRGSDDPSGLISSEQLGRALAALEAESRVLERQQSFIDVADGALSAAAELTAEAEALAVANANTGGMSDAERRANQVNLDSITQAIDGIFHRTSFAGERVFSGEQRLRVGGAEKGVDAVTLSTLGETGFDDGSYGLRSVMSGEALSITGDRAGDAKTVIGAASDQIAQMRGELGAFGRNVITPRRNAVLTEIENTAAARSVLRDADYAAESAAVSRAGVLSTAALYTQAAALGGRTRAINAVFSVFGQDGAGNGPLGGGVIG